MAKQIEAQATALADFDSQELQWASSLQEADRTLQERVATGSGEEPATDAGMEGQEFPAEQSEAKVVETIALERSLQQQREQHQAAAQSLLQAVQAPTLPRQRREKGTALPGGDGRKANRT